MKMFIDMQVEIDVEEFRKILRLSKYLPMTRNDFKGCVLDEIGATLDRLFIDDDDTDAKPPPFDLRIHYRPWPCQCDGNRGGACPLDRYTQLRASSPDTFGASRARFLAKYGGADGDVITGQQDEEK